MDKGSQFQMTLERMQEGGFVVHSGPRPRDDYGLSRGPVFASTSIEDALNFIRDAVKPVEPEQENAAKT